MGAVGLRKAGQTRAEIRQGEPAGQAVLQRAVAEASRLDERTVGAEHLLLALASEAEGSVPTALDKLGLSAAAIRRQIAVLLAQAAEQAPPPAPDEPTA